MANVMNKPRTKRPADDENLTFVDMLKAGFQPVEDRDEYLRRKAMERKQESELAKRRGQG